MSDKEKMSPNDICLTRVTNMVPLIGGIEEVREGRNGIHIELEVRAWVCPFCDTSTEYILVNGFTVHGCGRHTTFSKGKTSDCCSDYRCKMKQEKWHNDGVVRNETRNQI